MSVLQPIESSGRRAISTRCVEFIKAFKYPARFDVESNFCSRLLLTRTQLHPNRHPKSCVTNQVIHLLPARCWFEFPQRVLAGVQPHLPLALTTALDLDPLLPKVTACIITF